MKHNFEFTFAAVLLVLKQLCVYLFGLGLAVDCLMMVAIAMEVHGPLATYRGFFDTHWCRV